jgi:hypothetical protein
VLTETHLPEGVEIHKSASDAKDEKKHQRHLLVVQWLTFLAISIYAGITLMQWQQMKEATQETTKAANAAKEASRTAKDTLTASAHSFQVDQRPYLISTVPQFVTGSFGPDRPIKASETVKNIGKTPAIKMWWNIKLVPYHISERDTKIHEKFRRFLDNLFVELEKKNSLGRKELDEASSPKGMDIAPGSTAFTTNTETSVLTPAEFSGLGQGKTALLYVGLTSYTDAFGGSYKTEFCYFFVDNDPNVWHICDAYNHIR